uniref:Tubulin-specific chaperone E n=1 Tax=Sinocyclocheilus rhinocerous TaxID=307959 RepID=A0A673FU88_9TELE
MKTQEDAVGRRMSCDGERGTVRYVGPVPPTAGVWLGVEWDDPERGKHDGGHEGVRYFTCRHPKGGSFVRPKKASFGVDYVTALKQRYEVELQEAIGEDLTISSKTVMMAFSECKMCLLCSRRLENLTEISLRRCEVSGPGPENEIRNATPFARSLDLSGNLLSSWEVLAAITEQLESLRELQLSHNRLSTSSDLSRLSPAFSCLRVLSLNSCALTWTQVLHCVPMWRQVEELYLADNDITELLRPQHVLQALKVLDLSSNQIVQETVLEISHLPGLQKLNLSSSGLSVFQFSDASPGNKTALFPALKTLLLDDNSISEVNIKKHHVKMSHFTVCIQLHLQKRFIYMESMLNASKVSTLMFQSSFGVTEIFIEIEIDNDLKPLEFYSVEDGDRILVRWS